MARPARKPDAGHLAFGQKVSGKSPMSPSERQALQNARRAMQKEKSQILNAQEAAREVVEASRQKVADLQLQVELLRKRRHGLEEEVLKCETFKQEAAAKEVSEQDTWCCEQKPELEASIQRLTSHRDAWQELCQTLRRAVVQHEHQLKDLQEESERSVVERRKLQQECLSLQQECEGAQAELSESKQMLEAGSCTVEQMSSQRLALEWSIEESSKRQAHVQLALRHCASSTAASTSDHQSRLQALSGACEEHLVQHQRQAHGHRSEVAHLQQELRDMEAQCADLELSLGTAVSDVEQLETKVTECRRGKVLEQQKEAFARQRLEVARARKAALVRRRDELQRLCQSIEVESLQLQEEHAKLLLGRARKKAVETLQRSKSQEPSPVSQPAPSLEMALCRGFFAPAGQSTGVLTPSPSREALSPMRVRVVRSKPS
ncbi:unnamed protein product [Effrenium voratum]|nr:unnamed protein product [Effrenium voratum]